MTLQTKPSKPYTSPTKAAVALVIALAYIFGTLAYTIILFVMWSYASHGILGAVAAVIFTFLLGRWYWRLWL